jgi:hypothetical protein
MKKWPINNPVYHMAKTKIVDAKIALNCVI